MVQSSPMPSGASPYPGEPVHAGQQPLVPCGWLHATRLRDHAPGAVHALCQRSLVSPIVLSGLGGFHSGIERLLYSPVSSWCPPCYAVKSPTSTKLPTVSMALGRRCPLSLPQSPSSEKLDRKVYHIYKHLKMAGTEEL